MRTLGIILLIVGSVSFVNAAFPTSNDYFEGEVTNVGINPWDQITAYFDIGGYRFAFQMDDSPLAKVRYATVLAAFNSGRKIKIYAVGGTPVIPYNWGQNAYGFTLLEAK